MATSVLITGAGGLIGTWLRHRLADQAVTVVAVGRQHTDLLRPGAAVDLVHRVKPDAVVHLAWCASGDPHYRDSDDNQRWVRSTLELRDVCASMGVALWATGTAVDRELDAGDAYARSKAELRSRMADDIALGAIGWLRPYYVFDPVAGRPALIAQALEAREQDTLLTLREPAAEHDFIHASDVADAIVAALQHKVTGDISIGAGVTHSVAECAEALHVRWSADPNHLTGSTHAHGAADTSRLRAIGWSPVATQAFFGDTAPRLE